LKGSWRDFESGKGSEEFNLTKNEKYKHLFFKSFTLIIEE
jgi:hypothetical protein